MIKRSAWFLLSAGIILTGCTDSVEDAQKKVDQMAESKEAIIISLNAIQQKEVEMQTQFDEALTADEELTSFKDGSAPVFENIKSRQDELSNMEENLADMKESASELGSIEDESLPAQEIQVLLDTTAAFIAQLEAYAPAYTEQLQQEEEIFTSFGGDDADFNTLYDGVTELNDASNGNLATLEPVIESSAAFEVDLESLNEALAPEDES